MRSVKDDSGKKNSSRKKKHWPTILLIAVFLLGVGIVLYPTISDAWNSSVQSRAIVNYEKAMEKLNQADYADMFYEAEKYNAALSSIEYPLMHYDKLRERSDIEHYEDILNVSGTGIMGYLSIDSIDVRLPVYHGTSAAVLNEAVGHLEGTSLPTGGSGTHIAVSAHRGLPSAKLFTRLDELQAGDIFTFTVLDRELCYEVFDIAIVEPNEVERLYVVEGEDLATLVTCTPYGINTHRLLVMGRRVEPEQPRSRVVVPADGVLVDSFVIAPVLAVLVLAAIMIIVLVRPERRGRKGEKHE